MDGVPTPEQNLAWRMADVEARLEEISERLGNLEGSIRGAVAAEVQGATSELRRAISELGRRLVQDLPHELARHRDAIVAELRPPPPPPPPAPDFEVPPDPPPLDASDQTTGDQTTGDEEEPEDEPAGVAGESPERRRAHRLRRRPG